MRDMLVVGMPKKRGASPLAAGARRRGKKLQLHRLNNEADEDDERTNMMIWICHPPIGDIFT